jgi:ubiquitin-protein ligase
MSKDMMEHQNHNSDEDEALLVTAEECEVNQEATAANKTAVSGQQAADNNPAKNMVQQVEGVGVDANGGEEHEHGVDVDVGAERERRESDNNGDDEIYIYDDSDFGGDWESSDSESEGDCDVDDDDHGQLLSEEEDGKCSPEELQMIQQHQQQQQQHQRHHLDQNIHRCLSLMEQVKLVNVDCDFPACVSNDDTAVTMALTLSSETQSQSQQEDYYEDEDNNKEHHITHTHNHQDEDEDEGVMTKVQDAAMTLEEEQNNDARMIHQLNHDLKNTNTNITNKLSTGNRSNQRLARDLAKIMKQQQDTNNTHNNNNLGFSLLPKEEDSMDVWLVRLFDFPPSSFLYKDLMQLHHQFVELEFRFGVNTYPHSPPFVRVIRPRFKQTSGFIIDGAICMELLSDEGWSPVNDLESVIISIRSMMVLGQARVEVVALQEERKKRESQRFAKLQKKRQKNKNNSSSRKAKAGAKAAKKAQAAESLAQAQAEAQNNINNEKQKQQQDAENNNNNNISSGSKNNSKSKIGHSLSPKRLLRRSGSDGFGSSFRKMCHVVGVIGGSSSSSPSSGSGGRSNDKALEKNASTGNNNYSSAGGKIQQQQHSDESKSTTMTNANDASTGTGTHTNNNTVVGGVDSSAGDPVTRPIAAAAAAAPSSLSLSSSCPIAGSAKDPAASVHNQSFFQPQPQETAAEGRQHEANGHPRECEPEPEQAQGREHEHEHEQEVLIGPAGIIMPSGRGQRNRDTNNNSNGNGNEMEQQENHNNSNSKALRMLPFRRCISKKGSSHNRNKNHGGGGSGSEGRNKQQDPKNGTKDDVSGMNNSNNNNNHGHDADADVDDIRGPLAATSQPVDGGRYTYGESKQAHDYIVSYHSKKGWDRKGAWAKIG